ncbi:MAG TPA: long-chain fatty acid--CoA ligase [Candidatus Coprenecus stercoripullorum]|nr:long-chain fatty acid--CoA ligase [Candidatus Coprenecus stercoripullorum]
MTMIEQLPRTFDLLTKLEERFPEKDDMLCRKVHGKWIKHSVKDYVRRSHLIAYALVHYGYGKDDKAITICSNRPEWNFLDMGLNIAHMIHVPVYPTLGNDDFLHIFNHSDAKIIFVGSESQLKKLSPIIERMDTPARVILMDDSDTHECLRDLYRVGEEHEDTLRVPVEKMKRDIDTDEVASIIYTSGTTGTPKGVMLTHRNLMFNAYGHAVKQTVTSDQRMLSFLPLCHVYERSMNYEYQYIGISIYYAESLGTIARDLADCHANGFCAVPRVLEMMYDKLESAGKNLTGFKRKVYDWAWKFGNSYDNYNHGKFYNFKRNLADRLVYSKWREKLGGNEMLVVSGGSSIQAKIVRLFNAARLHIYEGYGMTETSPVIAVNSPVQGFNVIGTVGKPMEGTELKFADDGEILTKGPHVMAGYYKDPEATRSVIDSEGFMHTGDIGRLVDGEYLQITDRKKEIFKLSVGKYVAPQVIENMLRESPYIANCIVIGENQKFASAIIVPDFERLHFWAAKHKISYNDNDELIAAPKVIAKIHEEIEKVNSKTAPHEHIKRERIVCDEWGTANNMLSQTLKLKRSNIHKKYSELIREIYRI